MKPDTTKTAFINGRSITVNPKETLLTAALRQGVTMPFSCRVGGCGTCKCKLVDGKVKELTDTSYLFTDEDYAQGNILACQSVPQTDVRIEIDLSAQAIQRSMGGRVIGQRQLTHDITALDVQLDQGLPYKAGQYAQLSLNALPGVARNYSFSSPVRSDAQVSFFIRHLAQGTFSTLVQNQDLIGQAVQVTGPFGDFWLRQNQAPLLFVTGGSGLAPVLAMLQDALERGVDQCNATLLFGAREQRDLYAQNELAAIAQRWRGSFHFHCVLSAAQDDSSWTGKRGLVTEHIDIALDLNTQAYLCGPPAMVEAAQAQLEQRGLHREQICADPFLTKQPTSIGAVAGIPTGEKAVTPPTQPTVTASPPLLAKAQTAAGIWDYLKFLLIHAQGVMTAVAILAGGWFTTLWLLAFMATYIVGDALCGDDMSTPHYRYPRILTMQLWLVLPLLTMIVFIGIWSVSPGDILGFGAWVTSWTGYDVLAAKAHTAAGHHISTLLLTAWMVSIFGIVPGHELIHRTWDPVSVIIGRWLLAFSATVPTMIQHVYNHHRLAAIEEDSDTAPRGRNVYTHILLTFMQGNVCGWRIERQRLQRKGYATLSWRNAAIRGSLMSLSLLTLAWLVGGWQGALFFALCALIAFAQLEIVAYSQHYGLVRHTATPIQPHHSWNCTRRISSWGFLNLTRHAYHHAQGEASYHDLQPCPDAPKMIGGYITNILLTLIPPLWHHLMVPKLLEWDRCYATAEERKLAARANAQSGIAALMKNTEPHLKVTEFKPQVQASL